jgi:hypothetical protein
LVIELAVVEEVEEEIAVLWQELVALEELPLVQLFLVLS